MTSVAKPDWPAEAEFAAPGNPFQYSVYGLHVESEVRLSLTEDSFESPADVSLVVAESACFEQASAGVRLLPDEETWYRHAFLRDGRVYLRWEGLFEFVVGADGRQVLMASLGAETMESFQVYLLGHALGFALTLMGEEPLHATAVEANGKCVGLLGSSGAGKSTTAAYLLGRGARLVTDDVLRVTIEGNHARVHPGPQRIKLLPEAKQAFMAEAAHGVEMNPGSGKHIVALPAGMKHERTAILTGCSSWTGRGMASQSRKLKSWPQEKASWE